MFRRIGAQLRLASSRGRRVVNNRVLAIALIYGRARASGRTVGAGRTPVTAGAAEGAPPTRDRPAAILDAVARTGPMRERVSDLVQADLSMTTAPKSGWPCFQNERRSFARRVVNLSPAWLGFELKTLRHTAPQTSVRRSKSIVCH